MIRRASQFLSGMLIAVLWLAPTAALACGPFSLSAVFTFTVHPEFPLEKFAGGDIGVVQPSYARSYLYVAYRYLNHGEFSNYEQKELVNLWQERLDYNWEPSEADWREGWLASRAKVPGLNEAPGFQVYRNREKPNEYETYLNCQKDSLETAAETLEARIKQFGADNPVVKQWVEAQDLVFSNCSAGKQIPAPLADEPNALLRADRQYQIAAANFYAGNFDEAKTLFQNIAGDPASPWRGISPYLVARTLVRKASLGPAETRNDALAQAEHRLNEILNDQTLQSIHADGNRLLRIVRLRLHPQQVLHELGLSLLKQGENRNLKQDLWDYTLLLDDFDTDDKTKPTKRPANADDLTDWILTVQSEAPEDLEHSIQKWQDVSTIPWLVAVLSKIDAHHPQVSSFLKAAEVIQERSAAFPSVYFHRIRLDLEAGRLLEAQTKLDGLLNRRRATFGISAQNLFRHQRMIAASNLEEFLTYAERMPAAFSWDDDGREIPAGDSEVSDEAKPMQKQPLFDVDAAQLLNRQMPLSLLKEAAKINKLPKHLRLDVVQAVWLRSVLLGDHATATQLVPILKSLAPEMSVLLDDYLSKRQPDAKTFSAIYIWLHFPGLEPVVDTGLPRKTLNEQDSYRDNWWCGAAAFSDTAPQEKSTTASSKEKLPAFLTEAQTSVAAREYAALTSLGAGPNYIAKQVVEWATKNPADSRVPEALHLAVKTTRYGCADKQTGRWSKAAYDVLHRRYPRSDWTKQTPYWFKN